MMDLDEKITVYIGKERSEQIEVITQPMMTTETLEVTGDPTKVFMTMIYFVQDEKPGEWYIKSNIGLEFVPGPRCDQRVKVAESY
jgi:hypothetical protein